MTSGFIGLAQAAIVLFIVALTVRFSLTPQPAPIVSSASPAAHTVGFEIDEGRLVVIRWEESATKVLDRTPVDSYGVDDWYLAFGAAEAFADPVVAMKE